MTGLPAKELCPEELKYLWETHLAPFHTTQEVEPLSNGLVGQERAARSLEFGLQVKSPGYNVYVAGSPGTGKTTYTRTVVETLAAGEDIPEDFCYVYNFELPDVPLALNLPAGIGQKFCADMDELLSDFKTEIPKAVSSGDFDEQSSALWRRFQQASNDALAQLQQHAEQEGFTLKRTQAGFIPLPLRNGEPLSPEDFASLPEEERKVLEDQGGKIQQQLNEAGRRIKILEKETKQAVRELEEKTVSFVIDPFFRRLQEKYQQFARVVNYLNKVKQEVIGNNGDFRVQEEGEPRTNLPWARFMPQEPDFAKYKANLLVNNAETRGAPVVIETNPTYYNLFGGIEYASQFGYFTTDFTMIRPGALHRANGGYLVLQVNDLLANPFSWDALKRAMKNNQVRIENLGEQYRAFPTPGMKPEPVSLKVKVILIGNHKLYYLLYNHDEDFRKLFKIKADFDLGMPITPDNVRSYVQFIGSLCRREGLKHLDFKAVGRVLEHSSRLVGSRDKLSARFNDVVELIYDSNAWAEKDSSDIIHDEHVKRALKEKNYRSNLFEEKIREMILKDKLMVDTSGAKVGQVNGLAVYQLGDSTFGKPARITSKTFVGERGVVNIEREVRISGASHSKGVLILGGYLGATYGQDKPLTLSATLCFEQLYDGVDGDSASSAELYAILSSLSGLPLRQDLAVTGSVNQHGEIQPIGGINEKIEGFFEVCRARGFTRSQGVIMPLSNVDELMLGDEVIEAVQAGMFHIYPISSVDQGITLLTGTEAGERTPEGSFTPGTVHYLVDQRLREISEGLSKARRKGHDEVVEARAEAASGKQEA